MIEGVDWDDWPRAEFQHELDSHFPRTYACHDFTGRKCQFYGICHKNAGWTAPLQTGAYVRRQLNHPQENGAKAPEEKK